LHYKLSRRCEMQRLSVCYLDIELEVLSRSKKFSQNLDSPMCRVDGIEQLVYPPLLAYSVDYPER